MDINPFVMTDDLLDLSDAIFVKLDGDPFTFISMNDEPKIETVIFDKKDIEEQVERWANRCKTIKPMLYSLSEVLPEQLGQKWLDIMTKEKCLNESNLKRVYFKALLMTHPDKQKKDPNHMARAESISRYLTSAYKNTGLRSMP